MTATWIGAGMIVLVLGAARFARILDRRERALLTAMEDVRRAEWVKQRRNALAARMETQVTRGHDQVPLTPDEEQLFRDIADRLDPGRPISTAIVTCGCGDSKEAHSHYRPGSECSRCGCRRLRRPGWIRRAPGQKEPS